MMHQVKDEAQARDIVGNGKGYLYQSKVIKMLYLFVPAQKGEK
jgi:hypothetical protein